MTPDPGGDESAPGRRAGWSLAVLAAAEVALVGWALSARGPVLFILGQMLLLTLVAVVVFYRRYAGFRRAYEHDIARRAADQQRAELAGELHDVLGHELSLIALRAAALQVHSSGSAAEAAGQVRIQVEQAVVRLHQTMDLLRPADPASTPSGPTGHGLSDLVERANAAGADVSLTGTLDATVPAPIRLTAYRVAQEGLTNAVKHSPGAHVDIRVHSTSRELEVSVDTESSDGGGDAGQAAGSGLTSLQRRVSALGGELSATWDGGRHVTWARLPLRMPTPAKETALFASPLERRPMASTARSTLIPLAVVATVVVAFYAWASHGATLEQRDFEALTAGQSVASNPVELPSRQAPVRLTPTDPTPPGWVCRYYTDGNFPLAMASFEICDDGTTVTRVSDLRRTPLR